MTSYYSNTSSNALHAVGSVLVLMSILAGCAAEAPEPSSAADTLNVVWDGKSAIADVTASGSGCPAGTWSSAVADRGDLVTFDFKAFQGASKALSGAPPKDCTMTIKLRDDEGVYYIPNGVSAAGRGNYVAKTEAFWTAQPDKKWSRDIPAGGVNGTTWVPNGVDSPCGGPKEFSVRTQLVADAQAESSGAPPALDQIHVMFALRHCNPAATQPQAQSGVVVKSISLNGTGCHGSKESDVRFGPDGKSFDVGFHRFVSSPAASSSLSVNSCTLTLETVPPKGMALAITSFVVEGTSELSDGATAKVDAQSQVLAIPNTSIKSKSINGPSNGPFQLVSSFAPGEVTFVPCNVNRSTQIVLRSSVQARGGKPSSLAITGLRDVKFALKSCPNP